MCQVEFIPPTARVVVGDQRFHRQVMWHEWTPGVESVQDLVLQNVALVTQKVGPVGPSLDLLGSLDFGCRVRSGNLQGLPDDLESNEKLGWIRPET